MPQDITTVLLISVALPLLLNVAALIANALSVNKLTARFERLEQHLDRVDARQESLHDRVIEAERRLAVLRD